MPFALAGKTGKTGKTGAAWDASGASGWGIQATAIGMLSGASARLTQASLDERGMLDLGPLTPSVIADYCGVTRSSATELLDWLETRELLAREHRKDDRRSLELVLTDKGRKILDQALPSFWRACAHLTRELSDEDCQTLQTILAKVWR